MHVRFTPSPANVLQINGKPVGFMAPKPLPRGPSPSPVFQLGGGFRGSVDELRIWDNAGDANAVTRDASENETLCPQDYAYDLALYFTFNECAGNSTSDLMKGACGNITNWRPFSGSRYTWNASPSTITTSSCTPAPVCKKSALSPAQRIPGSAHFMRQHHRHAGRWMKPLRLAVFFVPLAVLVVLACVQLVKCVQRRRANSFQRLREFETKAAEISPSVPPAISASYVMPVDPISIPSVATPQPPYFIYPSSLPLFNGNNRDHAANENENGTDDPRAPLMYNML